jgi:hypothetical protein
LSLLVFRQLIAKQQHQGRGFRSFPRFHLAGSDVAAAATA